MMEPTTQTVSEAGMEPAAEDAAAMKRYEGLVTVRTKAIKGKGAWYWAHLEPILINNTDTGLPKAVKLRCNLCHAVFSASNPSRTASEHLKRGTCPNFTNSSIPASSPSTPAPASLPNRKRSSSSGSDFPAMSSCSVPPRLTYSQPQQSHLMLSGGKDDLGALAMLEDSVKKLKSPKTSPGPALSKSQVDSALHFLADWVYEACGSVSFSSLEHPKFRAFLNQVGLPVVSGWEFTGARLDAKFEKAKAESEGRIKEAMFFQISSDGWKCKNNAGGLDYPILTNLTVNLPNGTSLYRRAVFVGGEVPSKYAEEVLWETVTSICGNAVQQCVGVVADRFKIKALRSLERQNPWMVNLYCQFQGVSSLIKDLGRELSLFKAVTENCLKLASFVNNKSQVRSSFQKYQSQKYGHTTGILRVPSKHDYGMLNFGPAYVMIEDILISRPALELVVLDESFALVSMEDPTARDVAHMVGDGRFWNELQAVYSLVKLIQDMAQEIEKDKPLVGNCLPLWDQLRAEVKIWCSSNHIDEAPVENIIEKRFKKNYHPAWASAFILDPVYLIRDNSGKYLPPFKLLTADQEKDVDKLITQLVSREEAHIALMELMKWRTEGLDPVYARAVQMKERDPVSGKMRIANPQSSRLVWETYLTEFKSLGKVAVRLIFLHATSCGFKCSGSLMRWVSPRVNMDKAQKLIFIAAHSKLERRDFSCDEDKEAELIGLENGEDDVLNEILVNTSSV